MKKIVILIIISLLICVGVLSGCTQNEIYPKNPKITINLENNYDGQISGTIKIWGADFNYNRDFTMDKNAKNSFIFDVTRDQLGTTDNVNVSAMAGGGTDFFWLAGAGYSGSNWYRNFTIYGSSSNINVAYTEDWGISPE